MRQPPDESGLAAQDRGDVLPVSQQAHAIEVVVRLKIKPLHRKARHAPGPQRGVISVSVQIVAVAERVVYAGKLPTERGRRRDEMKAISGSHVLLTNIVIAWNTTRMNDVVERLRKGGMEIDDAWLRRMGPAHSSHINFRGTFRFAVATPLTEIARTPRMQLTPTGPARSWSRWFVLPARPNGKLHISIKASTAEASRRWTILPRMGRHHARMSCARPLFDLDDGQLRTPDLSGKASGSASAAATSAVPQRWRSDVQNV